jgi:GT2 family glycosyltransferase
MKETLSSAKPLVSVVIATWNRVVDLRESLSHFSSQTYSPIELIVVDNASEDGTVEMIEREFTQVKLIKLAHNTGVAAYNVGMQAASGDIIVVSDNDSYLEAAGVENIVRKFSQGGEKLGVVACEIIYIPQNQIYNWYYLPVDRINPVATGYPAHMFIGAGAAIRKAVLVEVGYYPVRYFLYMNEVDLSTRIIGAGYDIRFFPDIIAYHRGSQISRAKGKVRLSSYRNIIWYYWKYFPFRIAFGRSAIRIPFEIAWLTMQGTNPWHILKTTKEMILELPGVIKDRSPIPKQYIKRALGDRSEISTLLAYLKEVVSRKFFVSTAGK